MYYYSKPFDKSQAIDFMTRPINIGFTEAYEHEAFARLKEKLEQKTFNEIFIMFRNKFAEHNIVRFAPNKLAFRYWIN